jgi:glycosyltransferase involved in cell wall biosynthesis
VGLDNYPVMNPSMGSEYIGGESIQQTLLARAFSEAGYETSMIVKDFGQPDGELIDGIRIWKTYRQKAGLPVVRFIHPRFTQVWSALKRADADIYYQSCAGVLTGFVSRFCRRHRRTFIYRVASDSDCVPNEQLVHLWRDRKIYEYGLRRADIISSQSDTQIDLLRQHYGLDSIKTNMVVEVPDPSVQQAKSIDVLWVNNFRGLKQPQVVLELARQLPGARFTMVGGPMLGHEALYEDIRNQASALANVDFMGPVPYQEVNDFFLRSRLFLNTSTIEGFPNSFLQAWIRKLPVVSFFDPDGLIAGKGFGRVPVDTNDMAIAIGELLEDQDFAEAIGLRAHEYVVRFYSPKSIVAEYERLVQ